MEGKAGCYATFKTRDGQRFRIGSPAVELEVARFVASLTKGQSYRLPDTFLEFEQRSK